MIFLRCVGMRVCMCVCVYSDGDWGEGEGGRDWKSFKDLIFF